MRCSCILNSILVFLLLFAGIANAELWVCENNMVLKAFDGDGYRLGICGLNNTNIISNCIEATASEYVLAKLQYKKLDTEQPVGGRVVDWTQQEIDDYVLAQQQALDAEKEQLIDALDVSLKDVFVAFIKVYNSKVPAQYQITKQEIIDQLKSDLGL